MKSNALLISFQGLQQYFEDILSRYVSLLTLTLSKLVVVVKVTRLEKFCKCYFVSEGAFRRYDGLLAILVTDRDGVPIVKGNILLCVSYK